MKPYIIKARASFALRLIFHLIYIVSIAALPYIIRGMIDSDYANGLSDVMLWICAFASCIVLGMAAQYISQRSAWRFETDINRLLRRDVFSSIIGRVPSEYAEKDDGAYVSILNNDVASCTEYMEYVLQTAESMIGLVVYAVYLLILDWRIAIVMYASTVLALFLPGITGRTFSAKKQHLLDITGHYLSKTLDLLSGHRLVNRNTISHIGGQHGASLDEMEDSRYAYGSYKTFVNVLNGSVMYLSNLIVFSVLAFFLYKGYITAGIATATIAYTRDFMFPLRSMIDSVSAMKSVTGAKDSVIRIAGEQRKPSSNRHTFQDTLSLYQVSCHHDTFSLSDVNISFVKGRKYAITGANGSGKTTICRLLSGIIVPDTGQVLLDDAPIDYDAATDVLFYLDSKPHLFAASFTDNVTVFGAYDTDDRACSILPPDKLAILKGCADCSRLSGGEQQMTGLCRALTSHRQILLLDEPFSSVDERTEHDLTDRLCAEKDLTVIMVTHNNDPAYLSRFDEVLEVRDGVVAVRQS